MACERKLLESEATTGFFVLLGTVDGYEWRCRSQSKDNPHDVVRSVRKVTWFSESKLAITIILRLTRYWFGKSMNAFVVNDLKVNKNRSQVVTPKPFMKSLIGKWVNVKLRWGLEYRAKLALFDAYMNVELELVQEVVEEKVEGVLDRIVDVLKNKWICAFVIHFQLLCVFVFCEPYFE
ncbi:hypothetical protein TNCV_3483381 [Trichonephila clavipes]|nr:hypothetical protein TNCV_3483381 [Trichonephila clavipes]